MTYTAAVTEYFVIATALQLRYGILKEAFQERVRKYSGYG